jgi:hypothetical protein
MTFSLSLEAMAFKELLILVAIAIEDVDINITMNTTHLTIRTKLPVSQLEVGFIFAITGYPNVIVVAQIGG